MSPTAAENQKFITRRLSTLELKKAQRKSDSVEEDLKEVASDTNFQRVLENMGEFAEKGSAPPKVANRNLKRRLEETLVRFVMSLKKINSESGLTREKEAQSRGKAGAAVHAADGAGGTELKEQPAAGFGQLPAHYQPAQEKPLRKAFLQKAEVQNKGHSLREQRRAGHARRARATALRAEGDRLEARAGA